MTPVRWIVQVIPGPIDETVYVELERVDMVRVRYTIGHEERPLPVLDSLAACRLGQALFDATRIGGQERARIDARKRRS